MRRLNSDDTPTCLSIEIVGINTTGWIVSIDGTNIRGAFGGGHARVCDLAPRQEVTFTLKYGDGRPVRGGGGIPAKGGDIFEGVWRP